MKWDQVGQVGHGISTALPVPLTSCDLCSGKIWSCYFEKFMRRCIYKKINYLTFDLNLGVKVTRNVTQYPLHHVIYAPTKFQVATSNGLGEDTITRNVTDGRTTDRLWYEINIPYFSYEKAGIMISKFNQKELYELWILIQVLSKSIQKWRSYRHLKKSI